MLGIAGRGRADTPKIGRWSPERHLNIARGTNRQDDRFGFNTIRLTVLTDQRQSKVGR